MKRIVLHIDRLVLNGFAAEQRDAVARGLQSELGRLLAEPSMAQRLGTVGNVERVRTSNARVAHDAAPRTAGTSVARAIVNGVS
jgi:plasmid stabilization system protein ParE